MAGGSSRIVNSNRRRRSEEIDSDSDIDEELQKDQRCHQLHNKKRKTLPSDIGKVSNTSSVSSVSGSASVHLMKDMEHNGMIISGEEEKKRVQDFVRKQLFSKVKFITEQHELQWENGGKNIVGKYVTGKLNILQSKREEWWNQYGKIVYKALCDKRSSVTQHVMLAFQRKSVCINRADVDSYQY